MPESSGQSRIGSERELRKLYDPPTELIAHKLIAQLDVHCRRFIALSPFCCLGTSDAGGRTDVSPRGDEPGFVRVLGDRRLLVPDRIGNDRLDSMRNLLSRPRIGMLFMIPGVLDTLRVNGHAEITTDAGLLAPCTMRGRAPKAGLIVHVEEAFLHCGRALQRARLWDPDAQVDRSTLPKLVEMLRDQAAAPTPGMRGELDELAGTAWEDELY